MPTAKLIRDLEKYAAWEEGPDSPRAILMRQAAAALRADPTGLSDSKRLDEPSFQARGYRADIDEGSKEMRLVFFGDHGQKRVLAYMLLTSTEVYDTAQYMLKQYDVIEGIK